MCNLCLVLLGVLLNASAQVALKLGIADDGIRPVGEMLGAMGGILIRPWVLLGLALYAASVVNWLVVLSRWEISVAYPLMSLGYVITWLYGLWLFGEAYSHQRLAGLFVILVGIVLITRPVAGAEREAAVPAAVEEAR